MASVASIIAGAICLVLLPRLVSYYRSKLRGRPPPGPPGLPLVGNVRDIPAPHEYPWLKYHDWCREHNSDIIRLNALGCNMVVLDTLKAAKELLDRRSAIYSGRPRMIMLNELAGFGWGFGSMDYGEDWRVCRKMTHHEFHATASKKYRPILAQHAHEFVRRLTKESVARVPVHLKHMTGANIMQVTYGIKVLPEHDPFIELAEAGQEAVSKCAIGFPLVDFFPLLRYIPACFPGAGFKRKAAVWHDAATRQLHVPYADYVRREELGKADGCMAKALAEAYGTDEATVRNAKKATASMYMGGAETIAAVMHSFFLAMLLYPDVQARARRELEAALGAHRFPTFEDFGSVPYIDALIKELLRWQPIVRLGFPRKLREDDIYNGYYLEKDSLVIVNIW
ncbi:cytochrome P450 [Ganoderma leucocontextum]|nr:cytochrome P450 [Ganoderma leucocontextum]